MPLTGVCFLQQSGQIEGQGRIQLASSHSAAMGLLVVIIIIIVIIVVILHCLRCHHVVTCHELSFSVNSQMRMPGMFLDAQDTCLARVCQ